MSTFERKSLYRIVKIWALFVGSPNTSPSLKSTGSLPNQLFLASAIRSQGTHEYRAGLYWSDFLQLFDASQLFREWSERNRRDDKSLLFRALTKDNHARLLARAHWNFDGKDPAVLS